MSAEEKKKRKEERRARRAEKKEKKRKKKEKKSMKKERSDEVDSDDDQPAGPWDKEGKLKRNRMLTGIVEEGEEESRGTMIGQKRPIPGYRPSTEVPGLDIIGEGDDSDPDVSANIEVSKKESIHQSIITGSQNVENK